MIKLLRRIFGHDCPTRAEMVATVNLCGALEARIDQQYAELRALRGKVNAMKRWEKAEDAAETTPQSRQVAPGRAISLQAKAQVQHPATKAVAGNYGG